MRTLFLAGNWKMNTNSVSSLNLAAGLVRELAEIQNVRLLCVLLLFICNRSRPLCSAHKSEPSAQNVYFQKNGAFTGEISQKC